MNITFRSKNRENIMQIQAYLPCFRQNWLRFGLLTMLWLQHFLACNCIFSNNNRPFFGGISKPTTPTMKTCIITGANSGVGYAAAKSLLSDPSCQDYEVVFACRSPAKATAAIDALPASVRSRAIYKNLDLSDLESIRSFSKEFKGKNVECLALNAGVQVGRKSQASFSRQNFEQTIATNHIGHFLLLQLMLPSVEKAKGRVVFTASGVHNPEEAGGDVGAKAGLGDLEGLRAGFKDPITMIDNSVYNGDKAYKDSKLCNVLTCLELARRLKAKGSSVTSNCFNPGLAPTTGLFREFSPLFVLPFTFITRNVFKVAVSEEEAGERLKFMISNPELQGVSGQYFSGRPGKKEYFSCQVSKEASDADKAKKLWELTEKLVK